MNRKINFIGLTLIFIITMGFLDCHNSSKCLSYSKQDIYGAWVLYALNFNSKDSLRYKKIFPDEPYVSILYLDAYPIFHDTLSNGEIRITYQWKKAEQVFPLEMLPYFAVNFLGDKIVKVHFDDGGIVHFDQHKFPEEELLSSFIDSSQQIKFSQVLMEGYKDYKTNDRR